MLRVFCALVAALVVVSLNTSVLNRQYPVVPEEERGLFSVLVTGCTPGGIGFAVAQEAARAGFRVVCTVRKEALARDLERLGWKAHVLDLTQDAQVRALAAALASTRLFAVVHNAGTSTFQALEVQSSMLELRLNLRAPALLTHLLLPALRSDASGYGARLVFMGSLSGEVAAEGSALYSASKFGLRGLSEALRRELKVFGVHSTIVEPGPVVTPLLASVRERAYANQALLPAAYAERGAYVLSNASIETMSQVLSAAISVEDVARTTVGSILDARPRARYPMTLIRFVAYFSWFLPDALMDRLFF